jgi:NitT/TauT family transport system substrate-binding protein
MRLTRGSWLGTGSAALAQCALRPAFAQTLATLNVGAGLIESHAEAYYGAATGQFEKRGLTVSVHTIRNGSAIAAAVASGDLQIGCSTILQLAQARGHGIPYVIIVPGGIHDGRTFHTAEIVVPADSAIASAKELSGATVAVSTLNGLDQLATSVLIDKSGGDSSTTKFVEIPPSAMVEAMSAGRVAATSMQEPELSAAGTRVRRLGDGLDAIAKVFVTTSWFTTESWLAANKETARRFGEAIVAAGAWSMANPVPAAAILAKYLSFKLPRATQPFATKRDFGSIPALLAAAVKYKMIAPVNLAELVWDGR